MSALGAALAINSALTELKCVFDCVLQDTFTLLTGSVGFCSLTSNKISDVSALGTALATNTTLTKLKCVH